MRLCLLMVVVLSSRAAADEWKPPKDPDLQAILNEARDDRQAERYELALAKHVWFHANALEFNPAFSGVRLSFALSDWHELGKVYPTALAKLKAVRDEAAKQVHAGEDLVQSFHDLSQLNRTLGEDALTKETFEALDARNPQAARQVLRLAGPALIKAKAYGLYAKHIDPKPDLARIRDGYRQGIRLAEDKRFGPEHLEFARKRFTNDAATLVAVLAVTGRKAEAQEMARSAKAEWDDAAFHAVVDKALAGVVPDPWP